MTVTHRTIFKVLLLPIVVLLGIEFFLQLGALIVAASVQDKPTG